jgi:integrase
VLENGTVLTSSHVGRFLLMRANRLPVAKFSSHDLRRSFTTALVEMGVALDLVASIIGHEPGGRGSRTLIKHYVRTDMLERKAAALIAWDERLKAIVTGEDVAKVVQLNRAG